MGIESGRSEFSEIFKNTFLDRPVWWLLLNRGKLHQQLELDIWTDNESCISVLPDTFNENSVVYLQFSSSYDRLLQAPKKAVFPLNKLDPNIWSFSSEGM